MAGTLLTPNLTSAALTTNSLAWAGGNGVLSISGVLKAAANYDDIVVILENDINGSFVASGDAILRSTAKQIGFNLPACNVRARVNGADASSNIAAYVGV